MRIGIVLCGLLVWPAAAQAQEFALQALEESPRHLEWVEVPSGERRLHAFIAYPERPEPSLGVVVIHENRGLTDWVRSVADQLAAAGYVAIAPDLLSGDDDPNDRTSEFESSDAAREALYALDPDRIISDLDAVQAYLEQLPASDGRTVVMGFCWGGAQAFRYAARADNLSATLVFYGRGPGEEEPIEAITAPVYGFYGGDDARINAGIPETASLMARHGKVYEHESYEGAGHAFMRAGDDSEAPGEVRRARDAAWRRVRDILSRVSQPGP
ncbi:MAG TPA: dienelactone hydrolase family protein [bacterium]